MKLKLIKRFRMGSEKIGAPFHPLYPEQAIIEGETTTAPGFRRGDGKWYFVNLIGKTLSMLNYKTPVNTSKII
ncbi:MAG: hypothetical protein C0407_00410 [Desulfobacca sp.]|nr:hypothetical protein [Desulfobacca sp.]